MTVDNGSEQRVLAVPLYSTLPPFVQAQACPSTANPSDSRFPDLQRACARAGLGGTLKQSQNKSNYQQ